MHRIFTCMYSSFRRTILHRESHGVFTCPSPLTASPHISPKNLFLLFLTHYFFIRTLKKNWKVNPYPPLPESHLSLLHFNGDSLTFRPDAHEIKVPKVLISRPCSETLLTFHFLKQYNIILSLDKHYKLSLFISYNSCKFDQH